MFTSHQSDNVPLWWKLFSTGKVTSLFSGKGVCGIRCRCVHVNVCSYCTYSIIQSKKGGALSTSQKKSLMKITHYGYKQCEDYSMSMPMFSILELFDKSRIRINSDEVGYC